MEYENENNINHCQDTRNYPQECRKEAGTGNKVKIWYCPEHNTFEINKKSIGVVNRIAVTSCHGRKNHSQGIK